mmetsp:Transcript_19393/g.44113  ORF Transcript_19393/g.44113 Transcript_19393/m.44113 type:complete len:291 (-) Transcript_19393:67-939(-)
MQPPSGLCVLALSLLHAVALAEESGDRWIISSDVKHCVTSRLDQFLSNFSSGGPGACPYECANCLTDPLQCLVECTNREAACACSQALPEALDGLASCCEYIWDIFEGACRSAIRGLGETVVDQISHICSADAGELQAALEKEPGSLLVKTRATIEEGVTALISGMQAGAQHFPGTNSLMQSTPTPRSPSLVQSSSAEYVRDHGMGGACIGMIEDVEREHADGADESDSVPDLLVAASQISERASELLGKELPALAPVVHKALAVAWSEDGPGMDSNDVCEVILRHHDSL